MNWNQEFDFTPLDKAVGWRDGLITFRQVLKSKDAADNNVRFALASGIFVVLFYNSAFLYFFMTYTVIATSGAKSSLSGGRILVYMLLTNLILVPVIIVIAGQAASIGKRAARIRAFAETNSLKPVFNVSPEKSDFASLTNADATLFKAEGYSRAVSAAVKGPAWSYAEYSFARGGGRNTRIYLYSIMTVQVSRKLPHIIFRFKNRGLTAAYVIPADYAKQQKISVQGGFDDVFETYVPDGYHTDALSFITPEVMEVLLQAKGCDIEIIDDSIIIYSPRFSNLSAALPHFFSLAYNIQTAFDDNIKTYRDDRLPQQLSKLEVASAGRRLAVSPFRRKLYIFTVFFALIIGFLFILFAIAGLVFKS